MACGQKGFPFCPHPFTFLFTRYETVTCDGFMSKKSPCPQTIRLSLLFFLTNKQHFLLTISLVETQNAMVFSDISPDFLVLYAYEVTGRLSEPTLAWVKNLITAIWLIFFVDYVVRLAIARNRWKWVRANVLVWCLFICFKAFAVVACFCFGADSASNVCRIYSRQDYYARCQQCVPFSCWGFLGTDCAQRGFGWESVTLTSDRLQR